MSQQPENNTNRLAMMLAMDSNKLIGKEGGMPWYIPGELAYFKTVTMGKPVIMGRVTFDSLGKPLPGRPNFVVTRNADWHADGVTVCTSLESSIEAASEFNAAKKVAHDDASTDAEPLEIMVIGGAGLCREAMPLTQRVYLTHIHHEYEGDVWFDSFDWDDWREVSRQENEHEGLRFTYFVLDRV